MLRSILIPCALMALLGLSCARPTPPPPAPPPSAPPEPDPSQFSGERAWEHLEKLVEIGPRVTSTPGAEHARSYIRSQLEALGLDPEPITFEVEDELADGEVENVGFETIRAVMPGESDDIVLLAAPYDSRHFESFIHLGANNGASGAALLLEMARVLSVDPIPYTIWFAFLDGDAGPGWELVGSRILVKEIQDSGALSRLRLMVYFNQVADRDLVIARDLHSDRVVRRLFQRAARKLGYGSVVPSDRSFSRPSGGHGVFLSVGFRRVMIVMDDQFGGDEAPGVYWQTEEDTLAQCDPESLSAIVGAVTNAALRDAAALLRKVDRFSERPVPAPPPEPVETPDAGEAAETSEPTEVVEIPEPSAAPEPTEVVEIPESTATPQPTEAVETPEPPAGELSQ